MTLFYIQNRTTKEAKNLEDPDFLEYLERIEEEHPEDIEIHYDEYYNCLDIIPGYSLYSNISPDEFFYTDTMKLIKERITNFGELINFCYHVDQNDLLDLEGVFTGLLWCTESGESFDSIQEGVNNFIACISNNDADVEEFVRDNLESDCGYSTISYLFNYIDYTAFFDDHYPYFYYEDSLYIYTDI